jgi:glycosyltransferase involved in cell wall biosynthesis
MVRLFLIGGLILAGVTILLMITLKSDITLRQQSPSGCKHSSYSYGNLKHIRKCNLCFPDHFYFWGSLPLSAPIKPIILKDPVDARTVSIVVPYYNRSISLLRLLSELPKQTYPHYLIDVVIVDDGSLDPASSVAAITKGNFGDFKGLSILRHSTNKGRATARNSGVLASTGQVVVFIDADDFPANDYIEKIVNIHSHFGNVAVRGNIRILPELRRSSAFLRYRDSRFLGVRNPAKVKHLDLENLPPNFFATCGVSIERSDLLRVGLFDETFSSYGGEDEELGFRLVGNGIRIVFCAEANMWDADSSITLEGECSKYRAYGEKSGALLFTKCPDYRKYSAFSLLEPIDAHSEGKRVVIKKILLQLMVLPRLARHLRGALSFIDLRPFPFDPPGILYKYVLSASYLEGVKARKKRKHECH